ncbi:MAG: arylsulfatase [Planctomycetota bacterium]
MRLPCKPHALPALLLVIAVALIANNLSGQEQSQPNRPNIVLIMADDMGYTDVGCYGSEIQTPVLDRLANNGLRFTQFYNTSRCCPTRASLLTGLYSHQAGIGLMTGDRGFDAYRGDLNRRCVTLAEVLGETGYRTYMSGKWHVTKQTRPNGDRSNWPLQRGFDRFYGTIIGAGSFYDPATLCRGNQFITPENDPAYKPDSFYYTDAISDNAATFVKDHFATSADTPMFLYVAYTSAHWPMHAPEPIVEKYQGKYDGGYESIRKQRYQDAIQQGVIDPKWKLSPPGSNWDKFQHQQWDIRNMEVYAAMVDCMDQGIGRIIEQLEQAKVLDNTLIVYLQDNGGCAEGFGRRSNLDKMNEHNFKPLGRDGLQSKIWPPMQTRDGRFVKSGPNVMAGGEDTFVGYGVGWANASNTPFRGYKHDGYEGGISTPLIVHWPDGMAKDASGKLIHDPSHLIDIMPTFVEVAGAQYPTEYASNQIQPLEGVSLVPTLSHQPIARSAPICFEHHGNLALREGQWKIVSQYRAKSPRTWELYDMLADRTELNDLAEAMPEKRIELEKKWQAWADRVGVQTWPFKKPNK